jgi:hypothetical protein
MLPIVIVTAVMAMIGIVVVGMAIFIDKLSG